MTRAAVPPILLQLQNSDSLSGELAALRTIKNELIGHDQRKEAYVAGGIIPALAQVLTRWTGKDAYGVSNDSALGQDGPSEEYEACLQATLIIGSLAHGGPCFLAPIFASNVLSHLLDILSSPDCPPFFCISILRLLNTIADRLPLQSQDQLLRDTRLADLVFAPETNISALRRIIAQDYASPHGLAAIELTAALIGKLCAEEIHKNALAEYGVLDALAIKIASFVVAQGFALPGAEKHVEDLGALGKLPPPAPVSARLAPILRAVTVIIEHSKWRADHFLSSPGIVTVFPKQKPGFAPADIKRCPWGATYFSGSAVPHHPGANPVDSLLPSVPKARPKSSVSSINFPPLEGSGQQRHHSHAYSMAYTETSSPEDQENSIVPWLLCILRSKVGMVRLMAARLVTVLSRLGLTQKSRVPTLGYLLVPILLQMLDKDFEVPIERGASDDDDDGLITPTQRLKEEAPAVLANLVMDDPEIQTNAVDGKALKRLSQILKETYNPISENLRSTWYAKGDSPARDLDSLPLECRLGPSGYSPTLCHTMRYREGILKALAALVPFKDEWRKAVCENGVVPYIIDSLKPRPRDAPANAHSMPKNTAADGNPIATLLAACGAARMLTRSASVLRTSLIDCGVAEPLFLLIKHPDLEVQIAASMAVANLAMDHSPMKENAHSASLKLRFESLWVLKHVVYNSANDIRVKVIDGLGPEFIRSIISPNPALHLTSRGIDGLTRVGMEEEADQTLGIAMGRANSAGEQVNILNPMDDARESGEDFKMGEIIPSSKMSLDMFLPDAKRRRKLLLHGNLEQTTQSRQDDVAILEQIFDLFRNLMCGSGAPEMVDYIFKQIGQDELLDALADNLHPRTTVQLSHRRDSPSLPLRVPPQVLIGVIGIVIHISASKPSHQQAIIRHGHLLESLTKYFNHSHRQVRVNCVWTVINLLLDDHGDPAGCRERASRLKALGVNERLASLKDDTDLDIKERTKTAEKQIPYEYIEVNPYNKPDSLLSLNPRGLIPTLSCPTDTHPKPLYESTVIIEYLEEAYPSHGPYLLPKDPYERARARIWIDYVTSRIIPAFHRFLQYEPTDGVGDLESDARLLDKLRQE
ncbi:hypothetical protein N7495_004543 [Penicillium taxi]|uniref:uncharacterized protein n=1 Tax=Penicillium taxi TaxID=168475 RepID=UPI00254594F3|nr:uncharacterized protein N7495_004543 [Penicillium taxi]KAJ5899799.1 hypothetical protein N7495_004543 [Penicillium taxi]